MKRFTETLKWDDAWFRELPFAHKLIFIYVIERCNNAGFWEIDNASIAWHTKVPIEEIEGAWKGLARALIVADGWVWVRTFLKHQKNETLNESNPAHRQIIGLLKEQVQRFTSVPAFVAFLSTMEGPCKGLLSPIGKGNGNGQGEGNGTGEVRKGSAEGKPSKDKGTAEEVAEFFASEGLPDSDAVYFFEKCQGNGWMNSGKPIKDWKATVRSWRAAGYLPSQKAASQGKSFAQKKAAERAQREFGLSGNGPPSIDLDAEVEASQSET